MVARYKNLIRLVACSLFLVGSVFAGQQSLTSYEGTSSQSPIKGGCSQIIFVMNTFAGTIGNATYVSTTLTVPVSAVGDNATLGSIPYTVTGGHLYIIEVR